MCFYCCNENIYVKDLYKKYSVTQWRTQTGNLKSNHKVKIYFTSPEFSATKN